MRRNQNSKTLFPRWQRYRTTNSSSCTFSCSNYFNRSKSRSIKFCSSKVKLRPVTFESKAFVCECVFVALHCPQPFLPQELLHFFFALFFSVIDIYEKMVCLALLTITSIQEIRTCLALLLLGTNSISSTCYFIYVYTNFSSMCSLVCGIGPSVAYYFAPSICAAPVIMFFT